MHFTWNELHQRAEEIPQVSKQEADGRQQDFGKHIPLGNRHQIGDGKATGARMTVCSQHCAGSVGELPDIIVSE